MESQESNSSKFGFPKEYILLFLGAIISVATTLAINNVNNKHDEKKDARKERIQFADSLMRGLAKRFTYTALYFNAKIDGTEAGEDRWSKLNEDLEIYLASNVYYNYSRLRNLFTDSLADAFKTSVDDPFDAYKDYIDSVSGPELKMEDKKMRVWQAKIDTANHNFAQILYRKAFNQN